MNGMTYFEVNTTASASSVRVQPVTGRRYFDATAPAPNACASSAVGYATIFAARQFAAERDVFGRIVLLCRRGRGSEEKERYDRQKAFHIFSIFVAVKV